MALMVIFLAFSLLLNGVLGEFACEQLPVHLCSYSISSSGKRCLLESFLTKDGSIDYQCKTSDVDVGIMREWIESDECVNACGLNRNTVGISSDALLQPQFLAKLCSDSCYQGCPNIVNLYSDLAFGEGIYLSNLCANPRRVMYETRSNGNAASAPVTDKAYPPEFEIFDEDACAPTAM